MQYRSLKTVSEPAVEPVTLAEAKTHCRVDTSTDDAYLSALIKAAREYCEAYCDETFVHSQHRMTLDAFPHEIELPRPPMASSGTVTAVTVTWWAGRSADGSSVPQAFKNAILWLVGMWYERRMAADGINLSEIPFGVKALLDSAKWGSYR